MRTLNGIASFTAVGATLSSTGRAQFFVGCPTGTAASEARNLLGFVPVCRVIFITGVHDWNTMFTSTSPTIAVVSRVPCRKEIRVRLIRAAKGIQEGAERIVVIVVDSHP
ncbi:MAG TPA: hypothetical protein VFN61_08745 [Acidimicrobiales bacterium]|nr:hypothetical protein [Acidimicrobiales bacterium]